MPLPLNDLDRAIWENELVDFLPQQIYDAHVHVYAPEHCTSTEDQEPSEGVTWWERPIDRMHRQTLDDCYSTLCPGREVNYLLLPWPHRRGNWDDASRFTAQEAADDPRSVAFMLTPPSLSADHVADYVDRFGFRGLKPYRWWAEDENECRLTEMFPEKFVDVANQKHLAVTMHLGKGRAIADEENLEDLERLTRQYPNVQWILAHMARCLVPWPIEEAAERLKQLPNIWFDCSSVTNSDVFATVLRHFPLDRIMYGSDFPVDLMKGTYIGWGRAWAHLTEEIIEAMGIEYCDPRPTYIIYEVLRAARRAILAAELSQKEIEDFFCNNAVRLLGV